MLNGLRELLDDLTAFLGRYTVVELLVAFALASAVVGLAGAVISGLVVSPITQPADNFSSGGTLDFVIGGRLFQTSGILGNGLLVLVIGVAAGLLIRAGDDVLWQREGEFVECPHCLSEIPAAATVCSACTRDVPQSA